MFEYQGGVYPGVWVYDGSGQQVVGVRLYLTPGILSDPIPLSQVTIPGSTVGGIVAGPNPPSNPSPGAIWYNSGNATNSGIPAGSYGVWNGSAWVNAGSIAPSGTPTSSATAPVGPAPGAIWQNTSGGTLNGVQNGHYGVWNGSSWVDVGTAPPITGQVSAGVNTVNGLQGNITLAAGANITLTPAGQVITIASSGGSGGAVDSFNGRTGAVTPQAGDYPPAFIGAATPTDITTAIAAHVGAVDPHAQYLLPPEVFGSSYLAQNTAPGGPAVGQIWRNTSGGTVAGVGAGNYGVWSGSAWVDKGPLYPFLTRITPGDLPPTTTNPSAFVTGTTQAGVASATPTKLQGTAQRDPQNLWSNANSELTIVTTGFYVYGASALFDATAGQTMSSVVIQPYKNGAGGVGSPGLPASSQQQAYSFIQSDIFAAGDVLDFRAVGVSSGPFYTLDSPRLFAILIEGF